MATLEALPKRIRLDEGRIILHKIRYKSYVHRDNEIYKYMSNQKDIHFDYEKNTNNSQIKNFLSKSLSLIFFSFFNFIGLIISIFPNNNDMYLDNLVVAKKK